MKDFVQYLLKQIVSKPEEVKIEELTEEALLTLKITVAQEDMGVVIGKEGRTIKSIRALARAKAIKDGVRLNIELVDQNVQNANL